MCTRQVKRHVMMCILPPAISPEGPHLRKSTAPMPPTPTTLAMGASPMEAKKQTQDPNWHQINVSDLQPPQESWQYLHLPQG